MKLFNTQIFGSWSTPHISQLAHPQNLPGGSRKQSVISHNARPKSNARSTMKQKPGLELAQWRWDSIVMDTKWQLNRFQEMFLVAITAAFLERLCGARCMYNSPVIHSMLAQVNRRRRPLKGTTNAEAAIATVEPRRTKCKEQAKTKNCQRFVLSPRSCQAWWTQDI